MANTQFTHNFLSSLSAQVAEKMNVRAPFGLQFKVQHVDANLGVSVALCIVDKNEMVIGTLGEGVRVVAGDTLTVVDVARAFRFEMK